MRRFIIIVVVALSFLVVGCQKEVPAKTTKATVTKTVSKSHKCGAETKKGESCKRLTLQERCWQHK